MTPELTEPQPPGAAEPVAEKMQVQLDAGIKPPAAGQYLIVEPGPEAPEGVLTQVLSTHAMPDGTTQINGRPARVDEVIPEGDYDFDVDLRKSGGDGVSAPPGAPTAAAGRISKILLPEHAFSNEWCQGKAGPVTFKGSMSIDGDLKVKVKIRLGSSSVKATLELSEKAKAELASKAAVSCKHTTDPKRVAAVTFWVYGVMFVAFIDVTFDGTVTLDAQGSVTYNQQTTGWVSLEKKEFRSPKVTHDVNGTSSLTKSFTGKADLEGGITPAVGISFYGLSAAVGVRGYTGATGDSTRTPQWEAYAGLQGRVRFGKKKWKTFADKKWIIGRGVHITTASLPPATEGAAYSTTLTATDGKAPYTFGPVPGVALPAWLTVASDGTLSGTPPTNSPSTIVRIRVTDAQGDTADRSLELQIRKGSPPPTQEPPPSIEPSPTDEPPWNHNPNCDIREPNCYIP